MSGSNTINPDTYTYPGTYKLMWKMICYRPWLYILDTVLWILIHMAPLIPGLIIKEFFDILSGNSALNIGLSGLVAIVIANAAANVVLITLGAKVDILHRFNMSGLIRRNLLEALLNKTGAGSLSSSTGEILNYFRDDVQQIEDTISWMLDIIGDIVFAAAALYVLLSINAAITLLVFSPLVVIVVLVQTASNRLENIRTASRDATGRVSGAMGEAFSSVQAIQLAGAEEYVLKHIEDLNRNRHRMMVKDSLFSQLLDSVFFNTVNIGTGLILLLTAKAISTGVFSVGEFSLFVYYLAFVATFSQHLGNYLANYKKTGISFRRILGLMHNEMPEKLVEHNPLYLKGLLPDVEVKLENKGGSLRNLEVKGLTCRYAGTENGVEDISFNIPEGTFTVITGRTGSGKTTLLRALLGLLPVEGGEVLWNGDPVDKPGEFFLPPRCAYASQVPNLMSDSIRNNILLGLSEEQYNMEDAVYSAVLEQDLASLEQGLDTMIGPKGVKLSGGQKQRVAAARMLIRNTGLIVFDDISSALDVETEKLLWQRLSKRTGKTLLLVSNRKWALQNADQVILLKKGRIEGRGTLESLLENYEEMQKIWGESRSIPESSLDCDEENGAEDRELIVSLQS